MPNTGTVYRLNSMDLGGGNKKMSRDAGVM